MENNSNLNGTRGKLAANENDIKIILENVLSKCNQKIITSKIDDIISHIDLKDDITLRNINDVTNWLFIINMQELSLQMGSTIDHIPFEGDFMIWENIQGVLVIETLIYLENKQMDKYNNCISTIKEVRTTGDEATIKKRQKILQRVLNGSLLHDKEILEAQKENNIQEELRHRFLQFKRLNYMRIMGGSETYPIEYLDKEIKKEKDFLKEKVSIANF